MLLVGAHHHHHNYDMGNNSEFFTFYLVHQPDQNEIKTKSQKETGVCFGETHKYNIYFYWPINLKYNI